MRNPGLVSMILLMTAWLGCGVGYASPDATRPPTEVVPLYVHLDLVALTDAGAAQAEQTTELPAATLGHWVKSGQARIVESVDETVTNRLDAQFLLARKNPVVYYDPRNSQFQIQFVDTGLKMFIKTQLNADESCQVDISSEASTSTRLRPPGIPNTGAYPETTVLSTRTTLGHVRLGVPLIIVRSHGAEVRSLIDSIYGVGTSEQFGDHLIFVVSVSRT